MEWTDEAVVLGSRRHGESGAIAELFTRERGRFAAMVHGGGARRMAPVLQAGNFVRATWKARLNEQLGFFAPLELLQSTAATLLEDKGALSGLASATALIRCALPERQGYPAVYDGLCVVLSAFGERELWPALYARFELGVLAAAGYGLDLTRCALSGAREGLAFVSPKTGRAATAEAAAPFADKLLALPPFLVDPAAPVASGDVADAFALCGWFIAQRICDPRGEGVPDARRRLIEHLGFQGLL